MKKKLRGMGRWCRHCKRMVTRKHNKQHDTGDFSINFILWIANRPWAYKGPK